MIVVSIVNSMHNLTSHYSVISSHSLTDVDNDDSYIRDR